MAALVDTNVLVYRFDGRFPEKQKVATEILRRGIAEDSVRIPHQAIVEFIAAVTRTIRGHIILNDGGGQKLGQFGGVNGTTGVVGLWNSARQCMPASKAKLC